MTAPKRIVLEDTGERRYPKEGEIYAVIAEVFNGFPIQHRIGSLVSEDPTIIRAFQPTDYAIYRIVEGD